MAEYGQVIHPANDTMQASRERWREMITHFPPPYRKTSPTGSPAGCAIRGELLNEENDAFQRYAVF